MESGNVQQFDIYVGWRLHCYRMCFKCWFSFFFSDMSSLTLEDIDSVSELDRDTVPPLPPPAWNPNIYNPYGPTYMPPPPLPPTNYAAPPASIGGKPPYGYSNDNVSYVSMPGGNGSAGSAHSQSGSGESPSMYREAFYVVFSPTSPHL